MDRNEYHAGFGNWCRECQGKCTVPGPVAEDPPGHGWEPVFKTTFAENAFFIACVVVFFGAIAVVKVFW